jgi:glycogen operon protein
MLLGGDEIGRTQHGNNNAYCQANPISWYQWNLGRADEEMLSFVQELVAFRRAHPTFRRHHFLTGVPENEGIRDVTWWHPDGREMVAEDWANPDGRILGMLLRGDSISDYDQMGNRLEDDTFMICFNATGRGRTFTLPPDGTGHPTLWTAAFSTEDETSDQAFVPGGTVPLPPLSVLVLLAHQA